MEALAAGMAAYGDVGECSAGYAPADFVAVWGRRPRPPEYRHRLYLEAGYINGTGPDYVRNRLRFISAEWDGLGNGAASVGLCPPDRWEALGLELSPWRRTLRLRPRLLVLEQNPGDTTANPEALDAAISGRYEVRRRPHPTVGGCRPLAEDLAWADCAITWCSTAAVEAVIAGVPTVTLSPEAVARPVCAASLSDLARVPGIDRLPWAHSLAYRQWTFEELASGEAWRRLRCYPLLHQEARHADNHSRH